MKILIGILFLTILVVLHFGEFNAAEKEKSSSGSASRRGGAHPYSGRPKGGAQPGGGRPKGGGRGGFRVTDYNRHPVVIEAPPNKIFTHMGQNIEVWLDNTGTRIVQAEYQGNACPTGRDYSIKNFLVRLATLSRSLQIVEYVNPDGTLLGVRAPKFTNANVMEPTSTQWFIVYFGKYFRVRINPVNSAVASITLASKNEDEVVQGQRAEDVDMDGFKFFVFRSPNGNISGAALPS